MRYFITVITTLTISGCAGGMLPGNIYSANGKVMQFEIEKSRGSGAVKAIDASTGEQFSGSYVAIMPSVTHTLSAVISGGGVTASGFGIELLVQISQMRPLFCKGIKEQCSTAPCKFKRLLFPRTELADVLTILVGNIDFNSEILPGLG